MCSASEALGHSLLGWSRVVREGRRGSRWPCALSALDVPDHYVVADLVASLVDHWRENAQRSTLKRGGIHHEDHEGHEGEKGWRPTSPAGCSPSPRGDRGLQAGGNTCGWSGAGRPERPGRRSTSRSGTSRATVSLLRLSVHRNRRRNRQPDPTVLVLDLTIFIVIVIAPRFVRTWIGTRIGTASGSRAGRNARHTFDFSCTSLVPP